MILNKENLTQMALERIGELSEYHGYIDIPKDVDELHDVLLEATINNISIEEYDLLYNEMCNIINYDGIEIINDVETEIDILTYDPWKECCDADFYGV